jgi:hypothetical protein
MRVEPSQGNYRADSPPTGSFTGLVRNDVDADVHHRRANGQPGVFSRWPQHDIYSLS